MEIIQLEEAMGRLRALNFFSINTEENINVKKIFKNGDVGATA